MDTPLTPPQPPPLGKAMWQGALIGLTVGAATYAGQVAVYRMGCYARKVRTEHTRLKAERKAPAPTPATTETSSGLRAVNGEG